mmetsp:Transcript_5900/g.12050  ORF Transcript_5900/g.12050 Transcript_5900/m.12050 type:complete len:98 (-) Transcript_5900:3217-3510(-)
MINAEQKLRLGIVILIISILVFLALTFSGASMIARANSYLDANDIGYQTGNDDDPDAENDDDGGIQVPPRLLREMILEAQRLLPVGPVLQRQPMILI